MKIKITAFLLMLFIICSFVGCTSPAVTPENSSDANGTSPETEDKALTKDTAPVIPAMPGVLLTVNTELRSYQLNFSCCSLQYNRNNGTSTAINGDSSHPMSLEKKHHKKLSISKDTEAHLIFDKAPHDVTVYRWRLSELCKKYGEPDTISLQDGGKLTLFTDSVYMVVANWQGNDLSGSASFYFITEE